MSADADGDGVVDIRSQGLGGWVVDEADAGCPELLDLVRSLGGRRDLRMVMLRTALRSAVREVAAALLEAISLAAGQEPRGIELHFEADASVGEFLDIEADRETATASSGGRRVASARTTGG